MNKKEYLEKIENLIINRLKYHSPNLNRNDVDCGLLEAMDIQTKYPIFVFKKPLDKLLYKAFCAVKKKVDFNLILTKKPIIKEKKLKSMDKTFLLLEDEIGPTLYYGIDSLNVNYMSNSNFQKTLDEEYVKINGKKIDYDYVPYYKAKKYIEDGVICEIKEFLLNGKNYIFNFINTKTNIKKINFEFNLPLPRGYYFFKRNPNFVQIENLTNKDKAFVSFNFKNCKFSFSSMNGIESCTYARVNIEVNIDLLPKQKKVCFINFGQELCCLNSTKEITSFFDLSQRKMNEIFDVKLSSHDKIFDREYNYDLPRKIWESWQNFETDEKSENDWLKIKSNILKTDGNSVSINEQVKGIKEVRFFRDEKWKRVFIVHNNSCYMYADNVKYYNYTLLTNEIFRKNNEIYLSFAD